MLRGRAGLEVKVSAHPIRDLGIGSDRMEGGPMVKHHPATALHLAAQLGKPVPDIQGMIFLASCICDLAIETVEWTARWIAAKGDERL